MSLIKSPSEITAPDTCKVLLYGKAGTGKTTLALSAPDPLLLDFDGGVSRVNRAHQTDTVQITSWNDVKNLLYATAELAKYRTIVVDTVGKMMDFIIRHVCGTQQPQIRQWGTINAEFKWFTSALAGLGKHVIFVAHQDTRKEGEDTVFIPALREKNYNDIVTDLDLMGFVEMRSDKGTPIRTVTFDPTARNDGKNTCNLPPVINVPVILNIEGETIAANDFASREIVGAFIARRQTDVAASKEYNEALEALKEDVALLTDAQSANDFVSRIDGYKKHGASLVFKAKELFRAKVKDLHLVYDKDSKTYADATA